MKESEILAQRILNTRKDEKERAVLEDAYQVALRKEAARPVSAKEAHHGSRPAGHS